MNIESEILKEHSRLQADKIASWIGDDRKRFKKLMELFLKGEYRLTQRSAWVVSICAEKHPVLIRPYIRKMVGRMQEAGVHDAARRNVVRILQWVEIPPDLLGTIANVCFEYLSASDSPIAVKVFSMTVLARIAQKEPDLAKELGLVIEQQLPYASKGFHARARHIMNKIDPNGAATKNIA